MKYVLAFVGMLIGQLIGGLIADSRIVDWSLGAVLFIVGYQMPSFIKYARSSPKQLLAFHGPGAPISRSRSSGELRTFLAQLHEGGLLLDFDPNSIYAKVDISQWTKLAEPEKRTLAQVLMQAQLVDGTAVGSVRILGSDGTLLANYSNND